MLPRSPAWPVLAALSLAVIACSPEQPQAVSAPTSGHPPIVALPLVTEPVSGVFTLAAAAHAGGAPVASLELVSPPDGVSGDLDASAAALAATWDTTQVPNGAYELRVRATGIDGLASEAATTVTVANPVAAVLPTDATPPEITISLLDRNGVAAWRGDAHLVDRSSRIVAVHATDASGIAALEVAVEGVPLARHDVLSGPSTGEFLAYFDFNRGEAAALGELAISAVARDAAGNTASIAQPIVVDDQAPAFDDATPYVWVGEDGLARVRLSATDDRGVAGFEIEYADGYGCAFEDTDPAPEAFEAACPVPGDVDEGSIDLYLIAVDVAGNREVSGASFSWARSSWDILWEISPNAPPYEMVGDQVVTDAEQFALAGSFVGTAWFREFYDLEVERDGEVVLWVDPSTPDASVWELPLPLQVGENHFRVTARSEGYPVQRSTPFELTVVRTAP
jgi:hypothetical protein